MRMRITPSRRPAALLAALAALAFARPALAQKPVIFQGHSPVVTQARSTLDGAVVSSATLVAEIQAINNPSYLVLFPNGVVGYVPTDLSALGVPTLPPLYGAYKSLPNGFLQITGNTTFQFNGSVIAAAVNGSLFVYQGQFFAVLTYSGTTGIPVTSGGTTRVDVEADVATFVLPLQLVP